MYTREKIGWVPILPARREKGHLQEQKGWLKEKKEKKASSGDQQVAGGGGGGNGGAPDAAAIEAQWRLEDGDPDGGETVERRPSEFASSASGFMSGGLVSSAAAADYT